MECSVGINHIYYAPVKCHIAIKFKFKTTFLHAVHIIYTAHNRNQIYYTNNIIHSIVYEIVTINPWWRHQMETFSALLALCAGNSPITGEFPSQRPVTRSLDVFFDLRPNKPSDYGYHSVIWISMIALYSIIQAYEPIKCIMSRYP